MDTSENGGELTRTELLRLRRHWSRRWEKRFNTIFAPVVFALIQRVVSVAGTLLTTEDRELLFRVSGRTEGNGGKPD
jgi:hypothetical protein